MIQKKIPAIWIILIALALLYLYGSSILPLLGPDEPRYSQVARQMYESGDWITPRLGEHPWFEKPVLLYWLMSISFAILGVTEFAARLPSAISALLCVLLTYNLVKKIAGEKRALFCAIILGTSAFLIGFSHAATFDMLLTVCVAASLYYFFEYEAIDSDRKKLIAAYAFCGLGVLAKGFVAPVVIGLSAGIYWLIQHGWRNIHRLHLILGGLVFCVVAGIWLIPVTVVHGLQFWDDFFLQHHLQRYTSTQFHRAESVFFFIPMLVLGMYPWTGGIFCGFRKDLTNGERKLLRFSWVWLISSFLFFSFSRSKLPGYILPVAPPFAILSGLAIADALERQKKMRIFVCIGIIHVAVVAAILLGVRKFEVPREPIIVMAGAILVLAAISAWLLFKYRLRLSLFSQCLIPVMAILIAIHGIYPATDWNETRALSRAINPELDDFNKIAVYNIYDFPLVFYTNARVQLNQQGYFINLKNDSELFQYLRPRAYGYIIVFNEELQWMKRANFLYVRKIISGPERSIVQVSCRPRRK